MFEQVLVAFTALFVTIGPVDVAIVYAVLIDDDMSKPERHRIILRAVTAALVILLLFAFLGNHILNYLGVSLQALRIAGGILLFITSIDLVFSGRSDSTSANSEEQKEAIIRDDIAIFPLAMPMMSGPAAIGTVILLMANAQDASRSGWIITGMIFLVMLMCYLCLLTASQLRRFLGVTGQNVVSRAMGLLLAVLATQFVLDGLQGSLFA